MSKIGSIYSWVVALGLILVLIIILVSGGIQTVEKISGIWNGSNHSSIDRTDTSYLFFEDIDNGLGNHAISMGDSLILLKIWQNQKYIYSQHDNLLADVRQETNNSIEKITSELNFWVAILAFLGVLVPIAITHKGENEARNWLEKKEAVYDEKIRNSIVGIQLKMKEQSEHNARKLLELTSWESSTKKEFKIRGKEQQRLILELKIQRDVEMMTSIRNNRFLETDSELRKAYNETAKTLVDRFLKYLNENIEEYVNDRNQNIKKDLTRMSLLFFDVLNNLKLTHTEPGRPRALYLAEDAVKSLIKDLMEAVPDPNKLETIYKEINKYVAKFLNKL